jgi:hypothetical protein
MLYWPELFPQAPDMSSELPSTPRHSIIRRSALATVALLGFGLGGPLPGIQAQVYQVPPPPTMVGAPVGSPVGTPMAAAYRVLVISDSYAVLQQVKKVAPDAFFEPIGVRKVIQAGAFSTEYGARNRVAELANVGVQSAIYGANAYPDPNPNPNNPYPNPAPAAAAKGYYAVVPGNGDLVKVAEKMLTLGLPRNVLIPRDKPLGPHIAIGPYPKREDAEAMSQWLRNGSLDARVYLQR